MLHFGSLPVGPHDADKLDVPPETGHVRRNVAGPAKHGRNMASMEDGDRRFRRDAMHRSVHEAIEQNVADHDDLSGETPRREVPGERRNTLRHAGQLA